MTVIDGRVTMIIYQGHHVIGIPSLVAEESCVDRAFVAQSSAANEK